MPKKSYIYDGSTWVEMTSTFPVQNATTSTSGIVSLLDSNNSTSTTTAATPNSVLQVTQNIQKNLYGTTRIGNVPSFFANSASTGTLSIVRLTRHLPQRDFTVTNISYISGNTAALSPSLIRFGIYVPFYANLQFPTFRLVARTENDTNIFSSSNTRYTRSLSGAGGYPLEYQFVAGKEYFTAWIQVGGTSASVLGAPSTSLAMGNAFRGYEYSITAQTDLQPWYVNVASNTSRFYSEVS